MKSYNIFLNIFTGLNLKVLLYYNNPIMINRFLITIDMYGEPIKVYLDKRSEIKTPFGGFLSITMVIVTTILCWFLGKDTILRENPFSYQQKSIFSNYTKINVNETTFAFSAMITDFNNVPWMDDKYLRLKLYHVLSEINENNTIVTKLIKTVELTKCKIENYPGLSEEQFNAAQLDNSYCLKDLNFDLQGFWGESKILYLNLAVEMCDYNLYPDYCHSKEEIKQAITTKGANFNIFYVRNSIDIKNYSNPFKPYVGSFYKYLDSDKNKVCEYFLQTDRLDTDIGLLLKTIKTDEYLTLNEIHSDSLNFDDDNKQFINFIIYSSNTSSIIFRKYIKASEVLASIGGIISALHVGFAFINLRLSRIKKFETVINKVFDFNLIPEKNSLKNNRTSSILFRENTNNRNYNEGPSLNFKIENNKNIKTFDFKEFRYLENNFMQEKPKSNKNNLTDKFIINICNKKQKVSLQLNFVETVTLLLKFFCKSKMKKKKLQFFEKGEDKIKGVLDITNFIIHLEEFAVLKKILFDESQRVLFDTNTKPLLNDERDFQIKRSTSISQEKMEENIKEFFVRASGDKCSDMDKKLLNYLISL